MREEQSIIKFNQKIPLSFSVIKFDSLFSHMHSNPQIVIVLDGEIEVQINEERFIAKENDIFLINQRVFHSMQSKENALVLSVLIDQYGFGLDQQEADNLYFNLNSIKTPDNTRIESIKYLLYSIVKFNTMENINSIYTNRAITYSLFAQLMNDFKLDITESNQKIASYDTITKITAYVHDNYKNKLSLQFLAEHFNYSIAYLSRLFKQSLNENFIEYYDSLRRDIFEANVYVMTPQGKIVELPNGSTPVDFAYKVHSEVGDKMVSAIVNDNIVPFDYVLKTGDIIKVNTSKLSKGPNKDWLNIVKTTQAKNKIKNFYSKREKDENLSRGIEIFENALRKKNLPIAETLETYLGTILDTLKIKDLDELYISIGSGKYTIQSIMKIICPKENPILKQLNKITRKSMKITSKISEYLFLIYPTIVYRKTMVY